MVVVCCEEFDWLLYVLCDVIVLFKQVGIYCVGMLCCFGGDVFVLIVFFDMIEWIVIVDGLVVWVVSFGFVNVYFVVLLFEIQVELYVGGFDQVFVGGLFLVQFVQDVLGGWCVNGMWKFVSGCKGVDWFGVGIVVLGVQDVVLNKLCMVVFCVVEVEIVENWSVVGMQGIGSYDLCVNDCFVFEVWIFVCGGELIVDELLYCYLIVVYVVQVLVVVNFGFVCVVFDVVNCMFGGCQMMIGVLCLVDCVYFCIEFVKVEVQLCLVCVFFYDVIDLVW